MCAIVDVNNCHKVFGESSSLPPAGRFFLDWLEGPQGRLVYGGTKFNMEIGKVGTYVKWLNSAASKGRAYQVKREIVDNACAALSASSVCQSNDVHLIALAQIAGARLLFSEDPDLHIDFRKPNILSNPRGRVYSTRFDNEVSPAHRRLLDTRHRLEMCASNCPCKPELP